MQTRLTSAINFVLGCAQLHELPQIVGEVCDKPMSPEAARVRYGPSFSRADQLQRDLGFDPDVIVMHFRMTASTVKVQASQVLLEVQQLAQKPRQFVV